jgi:hypothetical protein
VTTSETRGTSTSSVDSTRSLSTTQVVQVYTATPMPFAVSGLRVQALVSGLPLLHDPASTATNRSQAAQSINDSSGGLQRDHVLSDPAYTATNGSIVVSGHGSQHYSSRRRPPGPGDYTCKRSWPSRCTLSSVIKSDFQSTHLL